MYAEHDAEDGIEEEGQVKLIRSASIFFYISFLFLQYDLTNLLHHKEFYVRDAAVLTPRPDAPMGQSFYPNNTRIKGSTTHNKLIQRRNVSSKFKYTPKKSSFPPSPKHSRPSSSSKTHILPRIRSQSTPSAREVCSLHAGKNANTNRNGNWNWNKQTYTVSATNPKVAFGKLNIVDLQQNFRTVCKWEGLESRRPNK